MAFTRHMELWADIGLLKQDLARARQRGKNATAAAMEKKIAALQAEADAIPEAERTGPNATGPQRYGKPLSDYAGS